ncbi:MAG TPA: DUF3313 family protein [Gammaproteobacteria bacterium]|nr:DUF3313 family protein [Gammaproteobacteria bacterium]
MLNKHLNRVVAALAVMTVSTMLNAQQEAPELTHDGLTRIEDSAADLAYALPEADFAGYDRFIIMEPTVAFRKDWQRDFNRNQRSLSERVSDDDMERIKAGMAELFLAVFTEELEDNGYAIVEEAADDVMILRPAIINLDVAAPDLRSTARSRSYVTSAGSATLYIELFDSVTGQILARAADSRAARDRGTFQWATSVSNRAEARIVLRSWAGMLVDRLEEIHEGDD